MKATQDNWKDVKKYFDGTYIMVPEFNPHEAVYVDNAGPDGLKVRTINQEKGFVETPYEIVNPLANRRMWFQGEGGALLVQRIPARMWRKGISDENTVFRAISLSGNLINVGPSFSVVNQFFSPKPYFEELTKESPATCALNEMWAAKTGANAGLYLYSYHVGKLSIPKRTLHLLRELRSIKLPNAFAKWKVHYV